MHCLSNSHTKLGGGGASERRSFLAAFLSACVAFIALVLLCIAASAAIVCPLLAFAVHYPRVYTVCCVAAFIARCVIKVIRRAYGRKGNVKSK